jgi:hypothetical protein
MLAGSIQEGHEHIHGRLKAPHYIQFGNKTFTTGQHQLYCVDPSDIYFVSPALFLWIDTGIQELKKYDFKPRSHKID